jgi:sigma-B regulation protein RsbU (phosphoserine phosphatase)
MQVLLVDPSSTHLPSGTVAALEQHGWSVYSAGDYRSATEAAVGRNVDALVMGVNAASVTGEQKAHLELLVRTADSRRVATVVLADERAVFSLGESGLVDLHREPLSPGQLCARIQTLSRFQEMVRRMERELDNMQRLGKRLNQHFAEIDQEMRLAGRLQRDFLPKLIEPVGPLRLACLYRPASWVSGDIYDVFRVDESHVAVYMADAVGHGMAASLLTMYIKKAITAKRILPDGYELLTPAETLADLNDALTSQKLPNCQFVTAFYALINTDTFEMQYARAAHPYPLLIADDGTVTDLKSPGGLLGVFPGEEYPTQSVQLHPGEKLVIFSDGLEAAYETADDRGDKWSYYRRALADLAQLSPNRLVAEVAEQLDAEAGSLTPQDDVTILVCQIDPALVGSARG